MFAVIETGGKQHRVAVGDKIKVEKLTADKNGILIFDKVLLIDDGGKTVLGTPYIARAGVEAKIVGEGRLKKVTVFKIKPKKRYRKKAGHRQSYTQVEITKISGS
ncbi:MAG: 50S ribosomal protein L21 [Candidatus Colwellbacteria bacterium]|nr:50S ribosomal protein L21 [Candidatus Colwellbacteria bacterium]